MSVRSTDARLMNGREREIARLSGLNSIHFYSLLDAHGGTHSRPIMGILVFYGDSGILNYSQADPEFDPLLRKLLYQYHLEKTERAIAADAFSKRILETGLIELQQSMAGYYRGQRAYESSLLPFARQCFVQVEDIVAYLLRRFLELRGQSAGIIGMSGYRGSIALSIRTDDGPPKTLPLRLLQRNAFSCELSAGNLFDHINGLQIAVELRGGGIKAGWQTPDGALRMDCDYRVSGAGLHIDESLYSGGELRQCRNDLLREPVDGKQAREAETWLQIDGAAPLSGPFYPLPWGGLLARDKRSEPLDRRHTQEVSDCVYLMPREDAVIIKRYSEKGLRAADSPLYVKTDAVAKSFVLHRVGEYGVVETLLAETENALGVYKRELAGRYFYSLLKINVSPGELKTVRLRPIRAEDGVTAGYQLLDEAVLRDIWEGSGIHGEVPTAGKEG